MCLAFIVSSCVAMMSESTNTDWTFEPNIEVPDDGNYYIVPQWPHEVYSRPTSVSKEIGRLIGWGYSAIEAPELIQVISYKESYGGIWWEVNYDDQVGYFFTSEHRYRMPYVPNEYPPAMDIKDGYEGESLFITELIPSIPNSAGGVDVRMLAINPSIGKQIKYISLNVSPFNAVGDKVRGQIRYDSDRTVRATGPIEADGKERFYKWENVFYNPTIVCFEVNYLSVEYMDGEVIRYDSQDLQGISHKNFVNDCSYSE